MEIAAMCFDNICHRVENIDRVEMAKNRFHVLIISKDGRTQKGIVASKDTDLDSADLAESIRLSDIVPEPEEVNCTTSVADRAVRKLDATDSHIIVVNDDTLEYFDNLSARKIRRYARSPILDIAVIDNRIIAVEKKAENACRVIEFDGRNGKFIREIESMIACRSARIDRYGDMLLFIMQNVVFRNKARYYLLPKDRDTLAKIELAPAVDMFPKEREYFSAEAKKSVDWLNPRLGREGIILVGGEYFLLGIRIRDPLGHWIDYRHKNIRDIRVCGDMTLIFEDGNIGIGIDAINNKLLWKENIDSMRKESIVCSSGAGFGTTINGELMILDEKGVSVQRFEGRSFNRIWKGDDNTILLEGDSGVLALYDTKSREIAWNIELGDSIAMAEWKRQILYLSKPTGEISSCTHLQNPKVLGIVDRVIDGESILEIEPIGNEFVTRYSHGSLLFVKPECLIGGIAEVKCRWSRLEEFKIGRSEGKLVIDARGSRISDIDRGALLMEAPGIIRITSGHADVFTYLNGRYVLWGDGFIFGVNPGKNELKIIDPLVEYSELVNVKESDVLRVDYRELPTLMETDLKICLPENNGKVISGIEITVNDELIGTTDTLKSEIERVRGKYMLKVKRGLVVGEEVKVGLERDGCLPIGTRITIEKESTELFCDENDGLAFEWARPFAAAMLGIQRSDNRILGWDRDSIGDNTVDGLPVTGGRKAKGIRFSCEIPTKRVSGYYEGEIAERKGAGEQHSLKAGLRFLIRESRSGPNIEAEYHLGVSYYDIGRDTSEHPEGWQGRFPGQTDFSNMFHPVKNVLIENGSDTFICLDFTYRPSSRLFFDFSFGYLLDGFLKGTSLERTPEGELIETDFGYEIEAHRGLLFEAKTRFSIDKTYRLWKIDNTITFDAKASYSMIDFGFSREHYWRYSLGIGFIIYWPKRIPE
jgi:hypothetical protein